VISETESSALGSAVKQRSSLVNKLHIIAKQRAVRSRYEFSTALTIVENSMIVGVKTVIDWWEMQFMR
jgi:hypothetical protein